MHSIDITGLNNSELDELEYRIHRLRDERTEKRIKDAFDRHAEYVGKYYYYEPNRSYICVVSPKSALMGNVECICFDYPFQVGEKTKFHRYKRPEDALTSLVFNGLRVESVDLLISNKNNAEETVDEDYKEIPSQEFWDKLGEFIASVKAGVESGRFNTASENFTDERPMEDRLPFWE